MVLTLLFVMKALIFDSNVSILPYVHMYETISLLAFDHLKLEIEHVHFLLFLGKKYINSSAHLNY